MLTTFGQSQRWSYGDALKALNTTFTLSQGVSLNLFQCISLILPQRASLNLSQSITQRIA